MHKSFWYKFRSETGFSIFLKKSAILDQLPTKFLHWSPWARERHLPHPSGHSKSTSGRNRNFRPDLSGTHFQKIPLYFFSKKSSFLKICKKAFQKFNNRPTYTGVENLRGQLGTIPDFCRADKISKKYFENLDMFYCFLP